MINFHYFYRDEAEDDGEDETGRYYLEDSNNHRNDDDSDHGRNKDKDANYPCSRVILKHGDATWVDRDPFAVTQGTAYPHSSLKLLLLKSSGYWSSTFVDMDEQETAAANVCKLVPSFVRSTVEHAGPERGHLIRSEMQIAFLLALINPHFQAQDMNRFMLSTFSIFSMYLPANMLNPADQTELQRFLRTFGRRDLRLDDKAIKELTSLSKQPRFHNFALCFLMRFAPLWPHTETLLQKVRWLFSLSGGVGVSISRPKLVDATPLHTYLRRVEASFRNDTRDRLSPLHLVRELEVAERTGPNGPKDMEHICDIVNVLGRNGGWLPLSNGKGKDVAKVVELFADLPHLVKHGLGKRTKQSMPRSLKSKLPGL